MTISRTAPAAQETVVAYLDQDPDERRADNGGYDPFTPLPSEYRTTEALAERTRPAAVYSDHHSRFPRTDTGSWPGFDAGDETIQEYTILARFLPDHDDPLHFYVLGTLEERDTATPDGRTQHLTFRPDDASISTYKDIYRDIIGE